MSEEINIAARRMELHHKLSEDLDIAAWKTKSIDLHHELAGSLDIATRWTKSIDLHHVSLSTDVLNAETLCWVE